jgi:hypothetical protein
MNQVLDHLFFAIDLVEAVMVEVVVPKLSPSTTKHQQDDDWYPDKNNFPAVTMALDEEWELVSRTAAYDLECEGVPPYRC